MSKHEPVHSLIDELDQFVDAFGLVDLIGQLTLRRIHRLLDGVCSLLSDPVNVDEQPVAPWAFPLSDLGVGNAFLASCEGTALRHHVIHFLLLTYLAYV